VTPPLPASKRKQGGHSGHVVGTFQK